MTGCSPESLATFMRALEGFKAGATSHDLSHVLGLSARACAARGTYAKKQGLALSVGHAWHARWCVEATKQAAEEVVAEAMALTREAGRARASKLKKTSRSALLAAQLGAFCKVRQRVVPAASCKMPQKRGPASVFELGAFL